MTINTVTKSGRLTHCGVKLAAYVISYPAFDPPSYAGDFCRRYAEAFENAIQLCIAPRLIEEYEASADPKKRFRTRICHIELGFRITREEKGILSMVWSAEARRKGEILFSQKSAQTWDTGNDIILTAKDFAVIGRRNSTCNFFIEENEIVIPNRDGELRYPIKRRFPTV